MAGRYGGWRDAFGLAHRYHLIFHSAVAALAMAAFVIYQCSW